MQMMGGSMTIVSFDDEVVRKRMNTPDELLQVYRGWGIDIAAAPWPTSVVGDAQQSATNKLAMDAERCRLAVAALPTQTGFVSIEGDGDDFVLTQQRAVLFEELLHGEDREDAVAKLSHSLTELRQAGWADNSLFFHNNYGITRSGHVIAVDVCGLMGEDIPLEERIKNCENFDRRSREWLMQNHPDLAEHYRPTPTT